jgi:Zn finger protein HypA/HybF involved in hydrogenase expression
MVTMKNIEVMSNELHKSDVETIKEKREVYTAKFIQSRKGQTCMCGLKMSRDYKCKTCEAEFETLPDDAKYCPACLSSDLRIIPPDEMQLSGRIFQKIRDEKEAQIKELWSQKLSKKAIADKLGIYVSDVSDVVGIKKRMLPQEKIDYIRNAHLAGRSDWEIKDDLGRISEEKVEDVIADLCRDIREAYLSGIRPEDIGKIFGFQEENQVVIDHINGFIKIGMLPEEPGLPPLSYEEMHTQIEKHLFKLESQA